MPKFFEIFGFKEKSIDDVTKKCIASATCPFTGSICDGGGNRHQTKILLSNDHELRPQFDAHIDKIVPAVCSVDYGQSQWIVCPRRLMGFQNDLDASPEANHFLQAHEKEALLKAGVVPGIEYGVWSEIYLQYNEADTEIDYHFDFIVAPILRDVPLEKFVSEYALDESEVVNFIKSARKGGYIRGKQKMPILPVVPDLRCPIVIEVMTASTSGSDTSKGTDISAAFTSLLAGREYQGPGINKRQVWGRMATQLFAKSALAEFWGGKTFWLVQDELLKNIELTTKLSTKNVSTETGQTINFISMKYQDAEPISKATVVLDKVSILDSGISFDGNENCLDILLPKVLPPKLWLLKCMLRRPLSGLIRL